MEEVVDEFEVVGDDGDHYTILVYQKMNQFRGLSGTRTVRGTMRFALTDGSHVNEMEDGTFRVLNSDMRLRKT